jgi:hypothetical protein
MSFIKKLAKGAQKAMGSVGDTVDKGTFIYFIGTVPGNEIDTFDWSCGNLSCCSEHVANIIYNM